ncbi:2-oxoglutarate dehydrogenase complex dihydrolipoyllysine-residue succinyltransferase [Desulfosarcina sp.]|uniref:2-oxoglutarate dehydrogenase complex dihydrolipoyllysine-residue succinyltransferase n=1 Tax=Desulfosarcina sp. TaxID=2027861 RepID=UPI0029BEBBF1|nr:2-oxoglutarate dehydrogenase complex dihydrolipoyllysine-residue succinyltransferase [Desulfosarcina sp.]MDX2454848.1 2-oxoglutarate dehydrogenase complex dihydrolipoyllysine-residue succinyltransferase [Desulfosarcina sp.]MDX2492454.1 2-oxoglutarate dehydrogenase complex dihydrolipoyllysine-residue succinyltransferase [Desulfosarcina sp.]
MSIEIKIPSVGESVQEAVLAEWFKQDGDTVRKDDPLFVIETDKVTLEVVAEADGVLKILVAAGETVAIGTVVGALEPVDAAAPAPEKPKVKAAEEPEKAAAPAPAAPAAKPPAPSASATPADSIPLAPSVRRLIAEKNLDASKIQGTGPGGRLSKGDVLLYLEKAPAGIPDAAPTPAAQPSAAAMEERKPMTPIRKRIAERLLESKQSTAMLTTFNEIDMARAMEIRSLYKEVFQKRHGVALGFMSFFVKACVEALKEVPEINAFIDGSDMVYHNYQHIGVAVGTPRGLVVPVIRHVERMSFAQVEKAIVDYVTKIKDNRLELADLEGGTFTVSNGGVYGSLLSTPILNMPQSGILGMHKIEKRPVVIDDQIVIRPMMYVALSYDHRIVDGKGAVTFLKRVKEFVENPERMALEV